ncbi:hypothetical protein HZS_7864 [Henneguya salminicola]|nr:hypothetical protein HZS_7864 [Henneguya salminicola]
MVLQIKYILCFVLIFTLPERLIILTETVNYKICSLNDLEHNNLADIKNVEIKGCNDQGCKFSAGEEINIKISFIPQKCSKNLRIYLNSFEGGQRSSIHNVEPHLSNTPGIKCPIENDKIYTFIFIHQVDLSHNQYIGAGEFKIKDEDESVY